MKAIFPNFGQKRNGFHASGTFEKKKTTTTTTTKQSKTLLPWNRFIAQFFSSNIPEALFLLDSRGFNYVWRGYDEK